MKRGAKNWNLGHYKKSEKALSKLIIKILCVKIIFLCAMLFKPHFSSINHFLCKIPYLKFLNFFMCKRDFFICVKLLTRSVIEK